MNTIKRLITNGRKQLPRRTNKKKSMTQQFGVDRFIANVCAFFSSFILDQ